MNENENVLVKEIEKKLKENHHESYEITKIINLVKNVTEKDLYFSNLVADFYNVSINGNQTNLIISKIEDEINIESYYPTGIVDKCILRKKSDTVIYEHQVIAETGEEITYYKSKISEKSKKIVYSFIDGEDKYTNKNNEYIYVNDKLTNLKPSQLVEVKARVEKSIEILKKDTKKAYGK